MITGRTLLEALKEIDATRPEALDESLYATFGNDENGNADIIPIEALLPANDASVNGVFLTESLASDGMAEQPVIVLDDEGKTNPLTLLEETIGLLEQFVPTLMPEEYERFQAIKFEVQS